MNDLKFALRQLLKCRSFVTVAVLTLVSPIGDCAARGQTHTIRAATLPSAREVLDRYVRAVGGREQWLKLRFAHLTGDFESEELGFSGPLELWTAAPNRHAARIGLERYGQVLQGFDGKRGWVLEPQQDIRFIEGSDLERLREEADFRAQLHEPASFARIETTAQLSWEERVCYQLHFVTKSGRAFAKFFDRENGLLLGRRDPDGAMTIYRDHRSFEGLKMPTLELKSAGGLRRQTIQISSVEFAPIKGRVFDYRRYEPHVERKLFPIAHKNGVGKADAADEIILKEMASIGIPGLAIAVIQRGQLVKAEGYGFADIEARRPVTPATVFQLCSLTKSFTALSVAWLAEEAKVSLDDP